MGLEVLGECLGDVLADSIRMKYCLAVTGRAVAHRHIDGVADQGGAHCWPSHTRILSSCNAPGGLFIGL
mgnify:CR=1 FL=1